MLKALVGQPPKNQGVLSTLLDLAANGGAFQPPQLMERGARGQLYALASPGQQSSALPPLIWIGGHGTVPYEQKTQQSPGFGCSTSWQCRHS